jgi:large subunit ribosomal protein L25
MAEVLNVKERPDHGKRESRRLRRDGAIPAILYGHKEASVALAVSSDEMAAVVRHGGRVVELKGVVNEKALIRELQWDTFGTEVLHVDLTRVSEHERVTVQVTLELRGQAPGAKAGGLVELLLHELEIDCEALSIPEKIEVNVKDLEIGSDIKASDLKLPPGVTLLTDPETMVVHCVEPVSEEEFAEAEAGTAEPEVIGRKAEDEEDE